MLTGGVTSAGAAAGTAAPGGFETLGKDEFLKLFIVKLRNQDPLSPASDEEFIAQLAQFSALEQAIQSRDLLTQIVDGQDGEARSRLMTLLGRHAVVSGGDMPLRVDGGVPEALALDLKGDAATVSVDILDGAGNVIRTIDLGAAVAGRRTVPWDGLDARGQAAGDGAYGYTVRALDASGRPVGADALLSVKIDSLRVVGGLIVPLSAGRVVDVNSILEITT